MLIHHKIKIHKYIFFGMNTQINLTTKIGNPDLVNCAFLIPKQDRIYNLFLFGPLNYTMKMFYQAYLYGNIHNW